MLDFPHSRNMESAHLSHLSALAQSQRLALIRLRMRRYPDQVASGELAQALDLKSSTLSGYLATLVRRGLLALDRSMTVLFQTRRCWCDGLCDQWPWPDGQAGAASAVGARCTDRLDQRCDRRCGDARSFA
ncbi:helix-turn-helix domain-containing protein [Sedimentitalea todarodis]|uniref:helix-turn-helix domain-containing protein n=1 Tax=Sedimentitalea todarodis TaxID=1631240 RepID=UPI003743C581